MEVKEEFSENQCKIETVDYEMDNCLLDIVKFEAKEEPKEESIHNTLEYLDLNKIFIKTEIEQDDTLKLFEEKQTRQSGFSCEDVKTDPSNISKQDDDGSSQLNQYLTDSIKVTTREKPFTCEICNRQFSSYDLKKHYLRVHPGEKRFACKICNKRFSQSFNLNAHMVVHTGEKGFACGMCNKQFSRRYDLKRHLRVHTGEKPFACEICNKQFSLIYELKIHLRFHTGEKPFMCNICNKQFSQKCNLNKHVSRHHMQSNLI
uniref:Gastrula zinc finger protein XlCGF49.1-like isoform X2 n=1 Tax=Diabrotica virgifera virgifera TaxID=50390 RepID=A0A6P7G5L0_DIAVI